MNTEDINLEKVTIRLFELISELEMAGSGYAKADYDYERAKASYHFEASVAGVSPQSNRDAQMSILLEQDGLTERKMWAANAFKRLATEKELMLAISSNLRTLEMSRNNEHTNN